jgi:YVTN family beta-propeller protein
MRSGGVIRYRQGPTGGILTLAPNLRKALVVMNKARGAPGGCRGWAALLAAALLLVIGACGRTALDSPVSDPGGGGSGMGGQGEGGQGEGGQGVGGAGAGGVAGHANGMGGRGGTPGLGGAIGVAGSPGIGGAMAGIGGNLGLGVLIPITGALDGLVIDALDTHVYLSNSSLNRIEDVSLASLALQAPISVGLQPAGLDLTPDGRSLYVANRVEGNISVVDVASRQELRRINVPSNFSGDTPFSLAIAANGQALFSTTFGGSGFGGRMMTLTLATDAVALKSDFYFGGTTTEATVLSASADRSIVAAVAGDISSGPVFVYQSSSNLFSAEHDLNGYFRGVAVNRDGSLLLVDGVYLLDGTLKLLGTIAGAAVKGAAFAPTGPLAYRVTQGKIEIVDTSRFTVAGTLPLPDTLPVGNTVVLSGIGHIAVTTDGTRAAVITDHGLSIVKLR